MFSKPPGTLHFSQYKNGGPYGYKLKNVAVGEDSRGIAEARFAVKGFLACVY